MPTENSILQAIGNTNVVQLRHVVPPGCGKIYVKLEWENPTGSMKDRMAQAMIAGAEADGRLKPGDTIVEYTGGAAPAYHWRSSALQKAINFRSSLRMHSAKRN